MHTRIAWALSSRARCRVRDAFGKRPECPGLTSRRRGI